MKIIKIIAIIILTISFLILLRELYIRINMPYDNGRFFDENSLVVYEEKTIIVLFCLLLLNIFVLLVILFIRKILNKILNRGTKIIFIIFILVANSIFADSSISVFQQNAINYDSNYFNINDDFEILGNIEINGKNIILANNIHYWGASTERATWRLLLFLDDGIFLGMYTGIVFYTIEIRIEERKIYFSFDPEIGNVIDFTEGIPNSVWIDGLIFSYLEIKYIEIE